MSDAVIDKKAQPDFVTQAQSGVPADEAPGASKADDVLAQQVVEYIEKMLMRHNTSVPPMELVDIEGFDRLCEQIRKIKETLHLFSMGEFYRPLEQDGATAGYIKALQGNLRHLAWQCNSVAAGDLSQRVDFMGDFSEAFNSMTESLVKQREMTRQKQVELESLTKALKAEISKKEGIEAALRASEAMYRQRALHDPLTGIYNRSYFFETVSREMENVKRRENGSCCVMMMDIDHFKKFNDSYGHLAGDLALKTVANSITTTLRKSDVFARYGGEEFALFLDGASLPTGTDVAERIRSVVANLAIPVKEDKVSITISIGLCCLTADKINPLIPGNKLFVQAMDAADAALYMAKKNGRNMVWSTTELCDDSMTGKITC